MKKEEKLQHWDNMYDLPLGRIPWEIEEPPKELVELIQTGILRGGRALDIGCGTGNYSFYLAQHGFDEVVGVDFSKKALAVAEKHNQKLKLPVRFVFGDATEPDIAANAQFDFILDYSILHHIEPKDAGNYAAHSMELLKPGGKLLLVCYSDKDEFASGNVAATGTYGNTMFYRTADEVRSLYKGLTEISYKEARLGKRAHHFAHCFLFEKPLS